MSDFEDKRQEMHERLDEWIDDQIEQQGEPINETEEDDEGGYQELVTPEVSSGGAMILAGLAAIPWLKILYCSLVAVAYYALVLYPFAFIGMDCIVDKIPAFKTLPGMLGMNWMGNEFTTLTKGLGQEVANSGPLCFWWYCCLCIYFGRLWPNTDRVGKNIFIACGLTVFTLSFTTPNILMALFMFTIPLYCCLCLTGFLLGLLVGKGPRASLLLKGLLPFVCNKIVKSNAAQEEEYMNQLEQRAEKQKQRDEEYERQRQQENEKLEQERKAKEIEKNMITQCVQKGNTAYAYHNNSILFSRMGTLVGYTATSMSVRNGRTVSTYDNKGHLITSTLSN